MKNKKTDEVTVEGAFALFAFGMAVWGVAVLVGVVVPARGELSQALDASKPVSYQCGDANHPDRVMHRAILTSFQSLIASVGDVAQRMNEPDCRAAMMGAREAAVNELVAALLAHPANGGKGGAT